jgi:hypothetical protein
MLPIEGLICSKARCSVNLIEVYRDPASKWWISSAGTAGWPSRSRSHRVLRGGIMTRSVALDVEAYQATDLVMIRCANTSTMNAT